MELIFFFFINIDGKKLLPTLMIMVVKKMNQKVLRRRE